VVGRTTSLHSQWWTSRHTHIINTWPSWCHSHYLRCHCIPHCWHPLPAHFAWLPPAAHTTLPDSARTYLPATPPAPTLPPTTAHPTTHTHHYHSYLPHHTTTTHATQRCHPPRAAHAGRHSSQRIRSLHLRFAHASAFPLLRALPLRAHAVAYRAHPELSILPCRIIGYSSGHAYALPRHTGSATLHARMQDWYRDAFCAYRHCSGTAVSAALNARTWFSLFLPHAALSYPTHALLRRHPHTTPPQEIRWVRNGKWKGPTLPAPTPRHPVLHRSPPHTPRLTPRMPITAWRPHRRRWAGTLPYYFDLACPPGHFDVTAGDRRR